MYHVAIATVIFSHVKITCYFHMWRYHVFARKLTWYFIGIYIIIHVISLKLFYANGFQRHDRVSNSISVKSYHLFDAKLKNRWIPRFLDFARHCFRHICTNKLIQNWGWLSTGLAYTKIITFSAGGITTSFSGSLLFWERGWWHNSVTSTNENS